MEGTLYWLIEYGKVFLGYGFLMFIWPLVVFRNYLRGKGVTFKFSFCVTAQVVIINTVVLMLGLVHLLNDWTLRILFYGTFLYSLREYFALTPERKRKIKYLLNGSFGWKNFFFLERRKYVRILEEFGKKVWKFYKKHWLEYSMLVVALVYGVIYFSWGVLHDRVYGFSDLYIHHQWIYQLSIGNPFSSGIYPEGMHCVIYAMHALFGIKIFSGVLFIGAANIVLFLLALYCFFKEVFAWRFSAILALVIFLTIGAIDDGIITCLSRLQCALPQEFAFPAIFLCALYLIRYLRSDYGAVIKNKKTKWYWNENLIIFSLALASTIVTHFYATIMAFFVCLGIAIGLLRKIFTKERFVPLVVAALLGLVLAVVPMITALASGIRLQGSLYWAMSVMSVPSGDAEEVEVPEIEDLPQEEQSGSVLENEQNVIDTSGMGESSVQSSEAVSKETKNGIRELIKQLLEKGKNIFIGILDTGKVIFVTLYWENFRMLYEADMANILAVCHIAVLALCIFVSLSKFIVENCLKKQHKVLKKQFNYGLMLLSSFCYAVVYCSEKLNLPVIIDRTRICVIIFVLNIAVMVSLFDFIFHVLSLRISETIGRMVSIVGIVGIVCLIVVTGNYHGYLYILLSRYDAAVQITNQIIEQLPKESFTIVSPTEEMYQVKEYGYHEEIITFLENQGKESYTLPTEYVFIYVEKRALEYVQVHSFSGPKWLAGDKYREMMYYDFGDSVWPNYLGTDISKEEAQKDMIYYGLLSDMYSRHSSRVILESKMYYWCEEFKKHYPNEMKVLYEDENFVCYYWKQNTQRPYNLGLR